jgi:hypothetical protein
MALCGFTLQILQEAVREMILRAFAARILLVRRATVQTSELHDVLLRIAIQSGPSRAAHTNCFDMPIHGNPPRRRGCHPANGSTSCNVGCRRTLPRYAASNVFFSDVTNPSTELMGSVANYAALQGGCADGLSQCWNKLKPILPPWELVAVHGVKRSEDARTLTTLRARRQCFCKKRAGVLASQNFSRSLAANPCGGV